MGGIEVSRDGGAHQKTVRVLFEETILSHSGGDNMPVCICNIAINYKCSTKHVVKTMVIVIALATFDITALHPCRYYAYTCTCNYSI